LIKVSLRRRRGLSAVMRGFMPGIHVFAAIYEMPWMAGTEAFCKNAVLRTAIPGHDNLKGPAPQVSA
jgi:hypothetical protein